MSKSDLDRLKEINQQLLKLYFRLSQTSSTLIRSEIMKLETEKSSLSTTVLYNERIQLYINILRSAAKSLQLQRQLLHDFADRPTTELTPDEIRQKNIAVNKLKSIEKKIERHRIELTKMGLSAVEIDDIILEGYREQSERYLENSLRTLESTVKDYLTEYYHDFGYLPEDLIGLIYTWEDVENRQDLTYSQLLILDVKSQCKFRGISDSEIELRIKSAMAWDNDKKTYQLKLLKTKLRHEIEKVGSEHIVIEAVDGWVQQYLAGEHLESAQVAIADLILEMQMYGVLKQEIKEVFNSFSTPKYSILQALTNRLRRKS